MRVLLVAINYAPEPTGIAPYVAGLARGLAAAGHDVHVLTGVPHYPQWRNIADFRGLTRHEVIDGVPVTRVRHFIPRGGIGWRRALMEVTFGVRLIAARWGAPDVVLTVSPALLSCGMALLKARVLRRRPVTVLWSQDLYSRGLAEMGDGAPGVVRIGNFLEGGIYRGADHVIAIGESFRELITADFGVPVARTSVYQNWSHVPPAATGSNALLRQRLGWIGRRVALHAGNMGKKQGLEVVVAAARWAEAQGSELLFVLLGDGSERPALERAAAGCHNLQFIDPLPDEDFRGALAAADVLLLTERPGVAEMALPSKLTTYFQAGKPVVAAVGAHGSAARLVAAAGAGTIVPPDSAQGLIDGVLGMLGDPDAAHRCGDSARRYAEAHLQSAATVGALVTHLAELTRSAEVTRLSAAPATLDPTASGPPVLRR